MAKQAESAWRRRSPDREADMTTGFEVLRNFVRGECDWKALRALGAVIEKDADALRVEECQDPPVYEATTNDVAVGLLANSAIGTTLHDWARVLLTTGMIDLASLEDDPRGDVLLNALWDAANGSDPAEVALEAARILTAET
jgi:hypothetical protein